jgi:hypothetical protein
VLPKIKTVNAKSAQQTDLQKQQYEQAPFVFKGLALKTDVLCGN